MAAKYSYLLALFGFFHIRLDFPQEEKVLSNASNIIIEECVYLSSYLLSSDIISFNNIIMYFTFEGCYNVGVISSHQLVEGQNPGFLEKFMLYSEGHLQYMFKA
jgi:hypothetical protein